MAAGGISQFAVGDAGALTPLSPASVAVGDAGALNLAGSADGNSVYATCGSYIAQFTKQANGTLVPQTPSTVTTTIDSDDIGLYESGGAAYAYVLAQGGGTEESGSNAVYQFTVNDGGGLVPNSPPTAVLLGSECLGLAVDPIDGLVIVGCVGDSTLRIYSIGDDGTLTETFWSPVMTAGGVNDLAFYATSF